MVNLDPIWNRARADLVIATEHGESDQFLWEHSVRVARNASMIAKLPAARDLPVDTAALLAAALYHEAGWVVRCREGQVKRIEILTRTHHDAHREQSASFLETSLENILSSASLERASTAVRTMNDREIGSVEGRLLTEAENLEEFGVLSLWPMVRRGAVEGKGVQAVLDTWRRRTEYHFWTARLNDSFHFPEVRDLARRRLEGFERFMRELEAQHNSLDLQEIDALFSARPLEVPAPR